MMKIFNINLGQTLGMLLLASLSLNVACAGAKPPASKANTLTQTYVWHDGEREHKIWLSPNVVAEFNASTEAQNSIKAANIGATLLQRKNIPPGMRIWQVDNTTATATGAAIMSLQVQHPAGRYSPVFHDGPSSAASMRALPGNIIVYLNPGWDASVVSAWLQQRKLEVIRRLEIGSNIYLIKTGPGLEALDAANRLYKSGEVKAAFPDWWQEISTR